MLDAHTHILPQMDDGSRDARMSAVMLRREARQGVDRVLLTPHFYPSRESPEDFLTRRAESARLLEEALADRKDLPERILGAEAAYFSGMSRTEGLERLCIAGTNALLVELPFERWNRSVLEELDFLLQQRDIQPIMAHVERYLSFQPPGMLKTLCEMGMLIQMNAEGFLNWRTARTALGALKKRQVHFIGTDCHNTKQRPPEIEDALVQIEWKLGEESLEHLQRMESWLLD